MTQPKDEDQVVVLKEKDVNRYMEARDGDHLCPSFQCDTCHFRNIMGRDPLGDKAEDTKIVALIRRVNLDAFWSRERSPMEKNLLEAQRRALRICHSLLLPSSAPFISMGPYPLEDSFGVTEAILLLERSTDPGKHVYAIQFGTMHKMRSMFSNIYNASSKGNGGMVMAKDAKKMTVTKCKTHGEFFERFVRGAQKRMGDIVKPDRSLSLPILHVIMDILEQEWEVAEDDDKCSIAVEAAFYLITYCGSLRGEEVPLTDITRISKWWNEGDIGRGVSHVKIALLGRFKGETGEKYHLMPLAGETRSGLKPRLWVGRVIAALAGKGVTRGPLFRTPGGQPIRAGAMEPLFFTRLEEVHALRPDLIPERFNDQSWKSQGTRNNY